MPATIAVFQKDLESSPELIGIFLLENDKIVLKTKDSDKNCKLFLTSGSGSIISPNSELYLKELSCQDNLSQLSYYYIDDEASVLNYQNSLFGL